MVKELIKRGLRNRFKVTLGGTGATERAIKAYRVDAAVNDASEGIRIIRKWLEDKK